MAQQTVIAYFDNRSEAEKAMEAMVEEGVSRSQIRMLPDADSSSYRRDAGSVAYDHRRDEGGFWSSLASLFLPNEDRYAYAEGMSRGGVTLTITVEQDEIDTVAAIADRHGAVDMDAREASWRNEGWTGYSSGMGDTAAAGASAGMPGTPEGMAMGQGSGALGAAAGMSTPANAALGNSTAETGVMGADTSSVPRLSEGAGATGSSGAMATSGMGAMTGSSRSDSDRDEEIIPVIEEELRVGKRQVAAGRVRIRSYVVETPVEEQVQLRQERVHVERRPVDRAASMTDDAMFRERVIEAEERGEEAVISKEARVREELVLRKDVEDRTETVSDTVRRTQVDIEDDRTTGTAGSRPIVDRDRP